MDKINSNRSYTGLVQKYIGTAYDHVRRVSENLDELLKLADLDGIEDIVENITNAEKYAKLAIAASLEAQAARDEAEAIVSVFNDFYLGAFVIEPFTDNSGDPLKPGALYWDMAVNPAVMKAWDGSKWLVSYSTMSGVPHEVLEGLGKDDHTQYLTEARHTAIIGNPHNLSFTELKDSPDSYVGMGGFVPIVKADETGLTFTEAGEGGGGYLPLSGGELSGNLTVNGHIFAKGEVNVDDWLRTKRSPVSPDDVVTLEYYTNHKNDGNYLSKDVGGIVNGDILSTGFMAVTYDPSIPITGPIDAIKGFAVAENNITKALFSVHRGTSAVLITQQGQGAIDSPDTFLNLSNGFLSIGTFNPAAYDIHSPTEPNHLVTKQYIEDVLSGGNGGAYLPLIGGELSGSLTITGATVFLADVTDNNAGVFLDQLRNPKGVLRWDAINDDFQIGQRAGAKEVDPIVSKSDTLLTMKDGGVTLTSPNLKTPAIEDTNHLATVGFVRSLVEGGTGIPYLPITGGDLTGPLTVAQGVAAKALSTDAQAGFAWWDGTVAKGSIGWKRDIPGTHILQHSEADPLVTETSLMLSDGKILVASDTKDIRATDPSHLVVKSLLDQEITLVKNAYLPLTGGNVEGEVRVNHQLGIVADGIGFDGLVILANGGTTSLSGVVHDSVKNTVDLWLQGSSTILGSPAFILELSEGVARYGGSTPVSIENDNDLVTKKYVVDLLGGVTPPTGDYLPIEGGHLTGELTGTGKIILYPDGTDPYTGFAVFANNAQTNLKASFHYNANNSTLELAQNSDLTSGSPETLIALKAGLISVSSPAGSDIHDLKSPNNLTTKQYVDTAVGSLGGPFLQISGGVVTGATTFNVPVTSAAVPAANNHLTNITYVQKELAKKLSLTGGILTGELDVKADIWAWAVNSSDPYAGMGLKDETGTVKGAVVWNRGTDGIEISQQTGLNPYQTKMVIDNGHINVTSNTGASTVPVISTHLANKAYVNSEDNKKLSLTGGTVSGPVVFNSPVTAAASPSGATHLINRGYADGKYLQAPGNTVSGDFTIAGDVKCRQVGFDSDWGYGLFNSSGTLFGSFSYNTSGSDVRITQTANGTAKTQVRFTNGNVAVYAYNGASIAPAASNHLVPNGYMTAAITTAKAEVKAEISATLRGASGTYQSMDGKTVTVLNGLITDIS